MWFKLGKNWRSSIKNQLVKEPWWSDAFWQSYCNSKFRKSADIRRHKHSLWTLHSTNSVRMHLIILVLLPFLISIQSTIGLCKLIFNWAPLIFTQFEPYGFTWSEPCCVHIKAAYILEATSTWHIQHEFYDCRCDIVCIWYNDNFLTRGVQQKSNLSSFQSLAPGLIAS